MQHIRLYSLIDRRQRRKTARVQSLRRRLARLAFGCAAFGMLGFLAVVLVAGMAFASLTNGLPSPALLPGLFDPVHGALLQPTRFYDRSGQQLLLSLENPGIQRRFLSIDPKQADHFSPELIRTTVAIIDPEFWRGAGFSLAHLTDPQPVTIPERLVSDLLLWNEPAGLRRSLRMRLLAAQAVARYGHVQVLEWYLNSVYYGHLAFGADSAARLYLGQPATGLDLPGSALLVAASQAPALNPLDAPAAAVERQQAVINDLLKTGVIGRDEYLRAITTRLALSPSVGPGTTPAAAFSRLALSGLSARFGSQRLERGGLRVITTLDYNLQLEVSCLVRTQLARLSSTQDNIRLPDGSPCASARLLPTLPPGGPYLSAGTAASALVLDPQSGQVLALLGDTTMSGEAPFLTPRAPGSLLTPFVAVAEFARGFGPASLTWDIPASLPAGMAALDNPDGKFHGPVRLRLAIANDYLAAQAQLLDQVGAANVWRLAEAMGLSSLSEETSPGLIYGGGRVSALELAQAYGVFATMGMRAGQHLDPGGDLQPATVLYVEDQDGVPLWDARTPETQPVVTAQLAYLVHHVLSDATARWPSLGYPNPLEIGRPAGAKIGQVSDGAQVWAAGYTPQRVAVFWLGAPESGQAQPAQAGGGGKFEPRMVAGMWHALMQYITRGLPATDWPQPPGISRVEVCDPSGQLPTSACPQVVSEIFLNGSEPTAPDSLYRIYQINHETGRLATVFTPAALIEAKTFLVPPPEARAWAEAAKLPIPPVDYDAIQPAESSPGVQISSPDGFAYVRGKVAVQGTAAGEGFRFYQVLVGQGINPETWLQIGADGNAPVTDGPLAEWDTQGLDGLYAIRLQVIRADQTVETTTIQVTVDNIAPLVRVPYPVNAQVFQKDQDAVITFQAEVVDAIGVQRLVWVVDGRQAGETRQAPFAFAWKAAPGEHTLEVRGYDLAGNEGRSEQVHFSVR